jgi:hypothetical protein
VCACACEGRDSRTAHPAHRLVDDVLADMIAFVVRGPSIGVEHHEHDVLCGPRQSRREKAIISPAALACRLRHCDFLAPKVSITIDTTHAKGLRSGNPRRPVPGPR